MSNAKRIQTLSNVIARRNVAIEKRGASLKKMIARNVKRTARLKALKAVAK